MKAAERERWLKPSEATELFEQAGLWKPARSTFAKWARTRGISVVRSPGNQCRYAESEVRALVAAMAEAA